MAHIEGVIESIYAQPSKNIVIQPGVGLVEKGRTVQGPELERENQISLKNY